ncbi:insulinase family protein [Candidatus Saccharibacteria bacterium]|nr:insulinase family protein [Candidatus Saccharibacteria bacterium]
MRHSVEEVRLKNGARGLLIDVPGASVMSYLFDFRAGNRYVKSPDIYETAHIMEHMAYGANEQFKNGHAYTAEFEKNGAYSNAMTSDDFMRYVGTCAAFEWDRILGLQSLAITKPMFNNKELASEKGNVKNELTGYSNDYDNLLWPRIYQSFGDSMLTFSQRVKTVPSIKLADIKEHHHRTHTSDNMRFVITGRLYGRKTQIKKLLESWQLPRGRRFDLPTDEYKIANPFFIQRKDATNLTFGLSMVLPRVLDNHELNALRCVNHIFTGTLYSKVLGEARKRGLVYSMGSGAVRSATQSLWEFSGQVNYDTAQELFKLMVREITKVASGQLSHKDVDAAKQYLLGRHQMGAQTVSEINSLYAGWYCFDETILDYDDIPNRINHIKSDDIIELVQEFLDANIWTTAGVGNSQKINMTDLGDIVAPLFDRG